VSVFLRAYHVSVNDDVMESDRHAVSMRGRRTAPVIDQIHDTASATGNQTMRWLRRVSGIVWIFSWYTIYLEIFRWHHMTKSLRFNPPPPLPGTDIQPRPGAPLIAVCLGSVAAPLVFLTATIMDGRLEARPPGQGTVTKMIACAERTPWGITRKRR
jgi:hypothetical protein